MNVRRKGIPSQRPSGALAMSFVIVAGGGSVGLVMAVPALAVPLATASAVVGAAWPVATWMQKRSMSGSEVRDE